VTAPQRGGPELHYALDVKTTEEALRYATVATAKGVTLLEAGSLLIKSAGIEVVTALKEACPEATVIADMKTMDVGGEEVRLAADAGADEVIVAAAAADERSPRPSIGHTSAAWPLWRR
jgi:3-keto-L-gulonate-6-phosphate decarboxylase